MVDVAIARIASFKRMRDHKDKDLIVEALRESKELLEVSEDGLLVRRKVPLVPQKDHFQRSIYAVSLHSPGTFCSYIGQRTKKSPSTATHTSFLCSQKGFGEETPSLQLELEQFFSGLGDVKQVRMRRNADTSEFKGSVFVEYATLDETNTIAASKLQYNGKDLLVMTK